MQSNELAKVAGVSVRTLRHYHAIGLLPEPPRHKNGYREYDTCHLVQVLRIKQLASLGFPLERIGGMIEDLDRADGEASEAASKLDELDAALATEIERLEEQRRSIARVKSEQLTFDLSPRGGRMAELARVMEESTGHPTEMDDASRKAFLIAGHLYDDRDFLEIERAVGLLKEHRELAEEAFLLSERFEALAPDADEEARATLSEKFAACFMRMCDSMSSDALRGFEDGDRILLDCLNEGYNSAQQDVLARILKASEHHIAALKASSNLSD